MKTLYIYLNIEHWR